MDGQKPSARDTPLISARDISKSFGGVKALYGVDFELYRGEVHALLGPNGAGKSTLIKILNGVQDSNAGGVIEIDGRGRTESDIATVFQELSLVPHLTVAQNIFLGHEVRGVLGLVKRREQNRAAERVTSSLGLSLPVDAPVHELSVAQRQLVEIAKAVHRRARVLVLDEPTSTLTRSDQLLLFESVREIKRSGVGIIYVTHRLGEVFELADRVTVIRDGRRVLTAPVADVSMSSLVREITGGGEVQPARLPQEAFDRFLEPERVDAGDKIPRLRVEHLTGDRFADVSFDLMPGQIVGIAGLIGSGRTELLEALAGIRSHRHGQVQVNGKRVTFSKPWHALEAGVALVPEDRHKSGVVLQHSIQRNLTAAHHRRLRRMGWFVDGGRSRTLANELMSTLRVKAHSANSPVATLSGGNQQKVVFAKWLQPDLQILLLDEPTQGVDVGARHEIYKVVERFAQEGAAVLVVSSDFVELRDLCSHIHYMTREGLSEPFKVTDAVSDQSIYLELNERVHRGNANAQR